VTRFKTQVGAERFLHYLEHAGNFLERMQSKVDKWQAKEMAEVQQRAAKAAAESHPFFHGEPSACSDVGVAAGLAGVAVGLAPETGGASAVIIGAISAFTGIGSSAEVC
jgi:hypothetical protein